MISRLAKLVLMVMLTLAGCDVRTQGESGNVVFTPTDCGGYSLGCSFSDAIVIGGTVEVKLSSTIDLTDHEVTVLDPSIAEVVPLFQSAGGKNWELRALSEGSTKLVVVDGFGVELDRLSFETAQASRLSLAPFLVDLQGFQFADGVEIWSISANKKHSFVAGPVVEGTSRAMGRFTYMLATPTSAEIMEQVETNETCLLSKGCLELDLPVGTYDLSLTTSDGVLAIQVVFEVVESTDSETPR